MDTTQIKLPPYINQQLNHTQWQRKKADHEQRISAITDEYLKRRSQQHKDPVMDFLFEYYAFRPSHLKRWSPGLGTLLMDGVSQQWPFEEIKTVDGNSFLDLNQFPKDRVTALKWILKVLGNSANRPPSFGCFGMHEWAMVYKQDTIRHDHLPLRMHKEELAAFVESRPIVCTHFDAFRFFSHAAKPQNKFALNRENFAEMEQAGCLHTNMDLYKWAFKMFPWISSKTIRLAFELALKTRRIDMKASPYDLRDQGLEPIKIETEAGREEYLQKQKIIFETSKPIRKRLIGEYKQILKAI